jgi:hypothetical protein
MAWASGFKEKRVLSLVDRVIKRIFSQEGDEESADDTDYESAFGAE